MPVDSTGIGRNHIERKMVMTDDILDLNLVGMREYEKFLETKSAELAQLCEKFGEQLIIATQCMDQLSGQIAAAALTRNMEEIKKNIPRATDTTAQIVKARKLAQEAANIFGNKFRRRGL